MQGTPVLAGKSATRAQSRNRGQSQSSRQWVRAKTRRARHRGLFKLAHCFAFEGRLRRKRDIFVSSCEPDITSSEPAAPPAAPAAARRPAGALDRPGRPQRARHIGQQHPVELLAPHPRPAIGAFGRGHEGRRRMRVLARAAAGPRGVRLGEDAGERRAAAPGRGGDQRARLRPAAQAELEHVPGGLRTPPFGELVAPAIWCCGPRSASGLAPENSVADFLLPRAGEQAARPLHHHPPRLVDGGGDQRDAQRPRTPSVSRLRGCHLPQTGRLSLHATQTLPSGGGGCPQG